MSPTNRIWDRSWRYVSTSIEGFSGKEVLLIGLRYVLHLLKSGSMRSESSCHHNECLYSDSQLKMSGFFSCAGGCVFGSTLIM